MVLLFKPCTPRYSQYNYHPIPNANLRFGII